VGNPFKISLSETETETVAEINFRHVWSCTERWQRSFVVRSCQAQYN